MSTEGRLRRWFSQLLPPKISLQEGPDATVLPSKALQSSVGSRGITQTEVHVDRPVSAAASKTDSHEPVCGQILTRPNGAELDTIEWGQRLNGPEHGDSRGSEICEDLESRPGSGRASPLNLDENQAIVPIAPSVKHPYMNRWRILACCIAFFIQGVNDSAPGALLPYMERYYSIRYAMVSLIFVANAIGFIVAAPFCHMLNDRFGRAKILSACTTLNIIAYIALVCQPPFAVVVFAFLFLGMYSKHRIRAVTNNSCFRLRICYNTCA